MVSRIMLCTQKIKFCSKKSFLENNWALFQFPPPLSKYRVLCLFYVLLRLNAWCYALKCEEQICSELSICSPRKISLLYDHVKKTFQNWKSKGGGDWKRANNCLRAKIDLLLKKIWGKFSKLIGKIFESPSKNCQSYNFQYGNFMISN